MEESITVPKNGSNSAVSVASFQNIKVKGYCDYRGPEDFLSSFSAVGIAGGFCSHIEGLSLLAKVFVATHKLLIAAGQRWLYNDFSLVYAMTQITRRVLKPTEICRPHPLPVLPVHSYCFFPAMTGILANV